MVPLIRERMVCEMSRRRDPRLNYVTVLHGKPCGRDKCDAAYGDVLVETWNRGKASVDLEWTVAKNRVDNPDDHAGSCSRLGPDVEDEFSYPALPVR